MGLLILELGMGNMCGTCKEESACVWRAGGGLLGRKLRIVLS